MFASHTLVSTAMQPPLHKRLNTYLLLHSFYRCPQVGLWDAGADAASRHCVVTLQWVAQGVTNAQCHLQCRYSENGHDIQVCSTHLHVYDACMQTVSVSIRAESSRGFCPRATIALLTPLWGVFKKSAHSCKYGALGQQGQAAQRRLSALRVRIIGLTYNAGTGNTWLQAIL